MLCLAALFAVMTAVPSCGKPAPAEQPVVNPEPEPQPEPKPEPEPEPEPEPQPQPTDPREIPADDGVLRLLTIGNSFSADAVEQELAPLFAAAGKKIIIGNLYIGGCDLQTHWAKASGNLADYSYRKIVDGNLTKTAGYTLEKGLADEKWDYISFQEGAGHHGFYDGMHPYLENLIAYARDKAAYKNFKVVYHACWCAPKNSTSAKFGYYDYDQAKMYNAIATVTKKLDEEMHFDLLVNSFDAIQNGRTSYLGDNGFDRDGWHLSYGTGRYTASCLWFEKLTGIDVTTATYHPSTISDLEAKICQTAAHEAAVHPYTTADLSYFEKPATPDPGPAPGPNPDEPVVDGKRILAEWEWSVERAVSDEYITSWTGLENVSSNIGREVYSNQPGERGYILANKAGNGKLSWVQTDKTAWPDQSGDMRGGVSLVTSDFGCLPAVCGALAGDYYLFETTGAQLKAGAKIRFTFSFYSSSFGAKYWMVEYLDGETWKPMPGLTVKTETISGKTKDTGEAFNETITYNKSYAVKETWQPTFDFTLTQETPEAKIRLRVCSEWQVNDVCFLHPRTQSVQRIAGRTMPVIWEIVE